MGKVEFEQFLQNEVIEKRNNINRGLYKDEWFRHLNKLFHNVEKVWLAEYVEQDKIQIKHSKIEIYEEAIGMYVTKELQIFIGERVAKLTPIGTMLIGTRGRADLIGLNGSIKFILADKKATSPKVEIKEFTSDEDWRLHMENKNKNTMNEVELIWKITSNPPRVRFTELNQDTFLECLMQVING